MRKGRVSRYESVSAEDALTQEEMKKLMGKARTPIERFILAVLGFQGLRVSELCHMKKDWLKYSEKEKAYSINVPARQKCECQDCKQKRCNCSLVHFLKYDKEGEIIPEKSGCSNQPLKEREKTYDGYWYPKTEHGARAIPIFKIAENPIVLWFGKNQEFKYHRVSVNRIVKRVAKRFARKRVYPHCLRATCASYLAEKGFSADFIMRFLGWAKYEIAEHYVRKFDADTLHKIVKEKLNG